MSRFLFVIVFFVLAAAMANAQQPAGLWLDASQFGKSDMCLDIQAAIAALPTTPLPGGAVIDARNFAPAPSTPYVKCSVNPFTVQTNPLVLVNGGVTTNCLPQTATAPGCLGGVLLLPGLTIATDVPWIVPGNWSVIGQGGKVTVLAPSNAFSSSVSTGTVRTASGSEIDGSGTGWTTSIVGMVFTACPTSVCNSPATSYSNATVVGIVTQFASLTKLFLGSNFQNTLSSASYTLQAPVMAWATTTPCTPIGSCSGTLQGNTPGSVIQDIGISCVVNAGTGSTVSGCIPFWDQYGQERSQLKRISISGFLGPGIAIYTGTAQNGGPFEDLDIQSGTMASQTGTTCVEVGGTGVGGQPSTRGVRGLTCTNQTHGSGTGIGVDINTQNFSLSDAHFEDNGVGVEVGDLSSAKGIWLSDITGGPFLGTVVDISSNCATTSGSNCLSATTSDINVQSVYQGVISTTTFMDHITGNTASEPTLGMYFLGDGNGLGASSTRPVLTTSSTIFSSPNNAVSSFSMGAGTAGLSYIASNVTFFGFVLPNAISSTAIAFNVSTAESGSNTEDVGVYNSAGNLVAHTGGTTGLFSTTGGKNASWTISPITFLPGKYWFAVISTCTSSCGKLGGNAIGTFQAGGTFSASGGTLPSSVTLPSDSWTVGSVPTFAIH